LFSLKYSARKTFTGQEKRQIHGRAGKSVGHDYAGPGKNTSGKRDDYDTLRF
jgi:hypothetical protein